MKLDIYNLENKFSPKFINYLRDEDLDNLKKQLEEATRVFNTLDMYYCCAKNAEELETLAFIKKELENHYKNKYENQFFGVFRPWGKATANYYTCNQYTFFDTFFIRPWNGDRYICAPITNRQMGGGVISIKTPEEFYAEGDFDVPFYDNSFLAMLGFYIEIAEYIQNKYGALRPKCEYTKCKANFSGQCNNSIMLVPVDDTECLAKKGGES